MKVDVITMQAVNNYGSVLQTFATQEFFRQHGCDVRIINYMQLSSTNTLRLFLNAVKRSIRYIPVQILFRLLLRAKFSRAFDCFRHEFLNISGAKQYHSMNDFDGYESDADAFCTGSDQVWNSWWSGGILPEFYLAFIPDDKYKFAFSASFGKDKIDQQEAEYTQKYIDAYRHISVREDSALKILKEQYHYSRGSHILDPTLCLDAETWRSYVKSHMGGGYQSRIYLHIMRTEQTGILKDTQKSFHGKRVLNL